MGVDEESEHEVVRRVDAAMAASPRAEHLRPAERDRAGVDAPLAIGSGQTSSQPRTVRDMLVLLDVRAGQHVLDVGAGSCWTTAILARLVGPGGRVLGVERLPEVLALGRAALERADLPQARVRLADPRHLGAPGDAPFDRVLVSAMAGRLPEELLAQLTPDGVMVVPVAGEMLRVQRRGEDDPLVTTHGRYRFVPLVT